MGGLQLGAPQAAPMGGQPLGGGGLFGAPVAGSGAFGTAGGLGGGLDFFGGLSTATSGFYTAPQTVHVHSLYMAVSRWTDKINVNTCMCMNI